MNPNILFVELFIELYFSMVNTHHDKRKKLECVCRAGYRRRNPAASQHTQNKQKKVLLHHNKTSPRLTKQEIKMEKRKKTHNFWERKNCVKCYWTAC